MCMDPVSAGFAIGGAALDAFGSIMGGKSEAQTGRMNAGLLNDMASEREFKAAFDADTRLKKAAFDIENAKRAAGRKSGTVRSMIATTGFSQDSFSEVLADDAAEAKLEQDAIKYTGDLDAYEIRYRGQQEAKQLRAQAAGQMRAADDAEFAGSIGALTSVVKLGSTFAKADARSSTSTGWGASVSFSS
jgi:hypothetical protein